MITPIELTGNPSVEDVLSAINGKIAEINNQGITSENLAPQAVTRITLADASVDETILQEAAVGSQHIQDASIETAHIQDAAIGTAQIQDAAIGTAQIQDAAITGAKIGTATIDMANIKDAAIGSAQIQDAAITNAKIANLSVDAAKIANATITNAQIANATIGTAQIATGAITTALIDTAAIGTTQIADGSITDAKIVGLTANKITAGTIDAGVITVNHLAAANITVGTINGSQITDGAITTAKVGADAIDNTKLADNAVHNENIFAGTITGDKLVADTITAREIASHTITANEILTGTITAASGIIANAAITDAQIGSVSTSKITDPQNIKLLVGQIGGNNLLPNSTGIFGLAGWGSFVGQNTGDYMQALKASDVPWLGRPCLLIVTNGPNESVCMSPSFPVEPGSKYTISGSFVGNTNLSSGEVFFWGNSSGPVHLGYLAGTGNIINFSFTTTTNATDATAQLRIDNNGSTGGGAGAYFFNLMVQKGDVATAWQPNSNEIQNSSISITESKVSIDTQNFGLTLRDASNNPTLQIDAVGKTFSTQSSSGIMSLSGNSLFGKLVENGYWVTSMSNYGWYLRNRFTQTADNGFSILGVDTGSGGYGTNLQLGAPFSFLSLGTNENNNVFQIRHTADANNGIVNFWENINMHNKQLYNVNWSNKTQCGRITCSSTANGDSSLTFPVAFPSGSIVHLVCMPYNNTVGVNCRSVGVSTIGATIRASVASCQVDWIAMTE